MSNFESESFPIHEISFFALFCEERDGCCRRGPDSLNATFDWVRVFVVVVVVVVVVVLLLLLLLLLVPIVDD